MADYSNLRGTDKISQLHDANARKLEALAGAGDAARQNLAAQSALNADAWTNQLGFDPDSVGGRVTNLYASGVSGAARTVGQVMSLPSSALAIAREQGLEQEDLDAYTAYQKGEATPEQRQRLQTPRQMTPSQAQGAPIALPEEPHAREAALARQAIMDARKVPSGVSMGTPLDRIQGAGQFREAARTINDTFDVGRIVNQTARNEMSKDLKQTFDSNWEQISKGDTAAKATGIAKLIMGGLDAGFSNPQAVAEYAMENIPQLAIGAAKKGGAAALAVANIGYAADNYQKGIEKFQKENNGAYPDEATRNEMAMWAASTALAEQVGELSMLKGLRGTAEAVTDTARGAFKKALQGATRVPGSAAKGFGAEAATEGFQTYAEGQAGLDPATPEKIYESAVIGGFVGGSFRGGATAVTQVAEGAQALSSNVQAKAAEISAEDTAKAEALKAATDTGDVSALVDPKAKTYAPDVAVSALFNRSQEATPEEKQANLSQATEVVDGVQERVNLIQEDLDQTSPEQVSKYKETLAQAETQLSALDPANVQEIAQTTERIAALKDVIKNAPKEHAEAQRQMKALGVQLSNAQSALANFTRESNPEPVDVDTEVAAIKSAATPEEAQASAQRIVSLAMRDAGSLDEGIAASLAADESIGLSAIQRTYLRNFSESRAAESAANSLEKVSKEVMYGSGQNVGIAQYRQRMSAAIASGNEDVATRQLQQVQNFASTHASKAAAAAEALSQGLGTQIVRTNDGVWMIPEQPLTAKALQRNKGLAINSGRLVQAIQAEANALSKVAAEFDTAFDLRFRSTAAKASTNVEDVSQPAQLSQTEPGNPPVRTEVAAVQAQPDAGNDAGRAAEGDDAQASNEGVEATGQLLKKLDERLEYLNNPPADYTPVKGRQVAAWAQRQLDRIEAEMAKAPEGSDLRESLADARAQAKRLVAKAVDVVEGDQSLDQLEDTETTQEAPASPTQSTEVKNSVEGQEAVSPAVENPTTTVTDERQNAPDESTQEVSSEQPLSVFALSKEEEKAKPFQQQNLVVSFLKQSKGIALGKIKDFMSTVGTLAEALPKQNITQLQEDAFNVLKTKVKEWGPLLNSNIELMNKDFRYRNPFQFMLNDDSTMDENIQTAMGVAVLDYVSQFGTRTLFNDWEDINTILHRPKEQQVTPAESALLRNVGTQAVTVTGSIGALASRILGLKDDANTPKNLLPKVQAGMGAHVVDLMLQQGILVKTEVSGTDFNTALELDLIGDLFSSMVATGLVKVITSSDQIDSALNQASPYPVTAILSMASRGLIEVRGDKEKLTKFTGAFIKNGPYYAPGEVATFYRLNVDEDGEFNAAVREIFDTARNAKGAFTDLFGVEVGVVAPKLEATNFNQRTISGTDRGIPKPLKAAQDKLQKTALKIKQSHWNLLNALPESVVLGIAGFQEITPAIQKSLREGIQSNNAGIKKGWDNLKSFVADHLEGDLSKDFFIEPEVWINQRVGVKTQTVDPQANKLHRYVTRMGSWNSTVNVNDVDQMRHFTLRVMEGLGDKTDETPDDVTVQRFDALVSKPAFQDAIAAIRKNLQGQELSEDDGLAIQEGVAAGKEKMHSFDALVALAKFEEAQLNNEDTFEAEMSVEDDGKTNGPMLSVLLFGASYDAANLSETLARGGFYTQASGLTQYSQWRAQPGNEDLYQDTMRVFNSALSQVVNSQGQNSNYQNKIQAIYRFTGTLVNEVTDTVEKAGRNIVKTPLQAIFFGSSSKRSAESMADKLIEGILDRVQKLPDNPDDRLPLIKDLNTLGMKVSLDTSIEVLMENEFSKSEIKHLQNVFMEYVGDYVKQTVDKHFAPFMEAKRKMNTAANLTFNLYNSVFQAMKAKKLQELVDSGEIPVSKGKNPVALFDLSKNQEKEIHDQLKDLFPQMHSWMSQEDGNLNTGIRMAKEDASVSQDSKYMTEVKTKAGTHRVRSQEKNLVEPGVTMLSASVHSFDSGISHLAGLEVDSFNNHDARTTGLNELNPLAKSLNKATWDGLLNYSPLAATADALSRVIVGLGTMIDNGTLPPEALEAIKSAVKEQALKSKSSPAEYVNNVLLDVFTEQYRADALKLDFLATLGAVDQYPLQGGSYIVTDADRQAALDKKKVLATSESPEVSKAMDSILIALSGKATARPATTKPEPAEQPVSPFGELGTPARAYDTELVTFLEETPDLTVGKTLPKLYSLVHGSPQSGYRDFTLKLLKMMRSSIPADMPVKYVTKLTPETATVDRVPGATAWFSSAGQASEVAILSPDFRNSSVRPSTLIHELVHASVFQTMQAERDKQAKNPKYSSEVLRLEGDLKQLLDKAREVVNQQGLTQHKRAVANVDELIAYGMMHPGFQQDVLAKISLETKTLHSPKSVIVDGFRKFIDTLTQLLFAGSKQKATAKDVDGLSLLVANTTAIMSFTSEELAISGTATTASPAGPPTSLAMMGDPMATVENLDTVGLYNALSEGVSKHASEFNERIQGLLTGIVNKLYGPFGSFKDKVARSQASDALDIMVKAVQTGQAPFVADVVGSPFRASQQELFAMEQIEATVRAAIDSGETSTTSLAYNQLGKLYREARQRIKPQDFLVEGADWATASTNEKNAAQAQYDFVFKIDTGADGRSTYLSRFAALGLGHEAFSKLLNFNTTTVSSVRERDLTLGERVQRIFDKILDIFGSGLMGTFAGQQADTKLTALVNRLVDIEAKRRLIIATPRTGWFSKAEDDVRDLSQSVRDKVVSVAGSKKFREATNGYVRGAGAVARVVAGDRVEKVLEGMAIMRDEVIKDRHSFIRDMMTEVQGVPNRMMKLLLDAKRANEQKRKEVITNTEKTVLGVFANAGKDLSVAAREGVTQALLRTGAHVLLKNNRFTLTEIDSLVSDKSTRSQAIKSIEDEIRNLGNAGGSTSTFIGYYMEKANVLGFYKATGRVRGAKMMMNAHSIARLYGTPQATQITQAEAAKVEPLIEALVALYALGYTDTAKLRQATNVMRAEANRPDGNNGIEFLLKLQAKMEEESLQKLFKGNPALMVHGYTPEIYNSRTEIKIANEVDGRTLELQGWKKIGPAATDFADPVAVDDQFMYVLKGAGLQPYLSATFSLTDMAAKGSKLHNGFLNTKTVSGLANAQNLSSMMNDHAPFDQALMKAGPGYIRQDLTKVDESYMAPVINERGEVANFRYLMNEQTKDTILERDSRFEKVLGALAGSVYDKETSREQNNKAVVALKEEYEETYKTRPGSFVLVGRDSVDPQLKEIWDMLPQGTKDDIGKVWGYRGMMVRSDSLNVLFGYRKYSLAEMFRKNPDDRNKLEQLAANIFEWNLKLYARNRLGLNQADADEYAKRAAVYVSRGEQAWQELVKEVKDIIVVKSMVVLAGNIMSNLSYLVLNGVPMKDILAHHKVAMQGATHYLADTQELARLKSLRNTGYMQGNQAETDREINRLEDAVARNPVKEIIDAGLMPTIVDDVAMEDDPYSYKTSLNRWVEAKTSWMPEAMKNAVKQGYMTKDTSLYQALSRTTQLSDFVARYTLYQHLINRKNKPLSKEEAVLVASESFINYDVPMPKGLQYTDDMGFTMFSKYFLRVQRVLLKMVRDNPARVLSALALGNFMDLGPTVLDSSWVVHIGNNPFTTGALQYPTTLDELLTAQAAMTVFK